ncbi:MAG: methyltransferase domain-containing protein [Thermodesulfovibrionales bacterium]|jgi:ubiquinone/menaquinone biosynthesis C-methylase UbiE
MTKLNIGCGNKKKDGFLGVDKFRTDATDIVADIEETLPFPDSSIEEIWMDNVIEHIRDIPGLMKEIHRVCMNGAEITIITPHFASLASWRDPTHFHHLSYFSMDHFEKQSVAHYTGGGFKVQERRLSFGGILGNIGRLIFTVSPREYESNWCFIFRPSTLRFVLKIIKD